jgi:hypothetical protein
MSRTTTPRPTTPPRTATAASGVAAVQVPATVPNRSLVEALAKRFKEDPDSPSLPLVIVNTMAPTSSVHIAVIWDKWKELPIPQRGRVITDAYAAAFPQSHLVVRLPMGLTPGEALTQGYLRYRIIPLVRPVDKVTVKQVKDAIASAGGVLMQIGNDQQLRFATREQAEGAYRRLLEKVTKPIWTLSEESGSPDSGG